MGFGRPTLRLLVRMYCESDRSWNLPGTRHAGSYPQALKFCVMFESSTYVLRSLCPISRWSNLFLVPAQGWAFEQECFHQWVDYWILILVYEGTQCDRCSLSVRQAWIRYLIRFSNSTSSLRWRDYDSVWSRCNIMISSELSLLGLIHDLESQCPSFDARTSLLQTFCLSEQFIQTLLRSAVRVRPFVVTSSILLDSYQYLQKRSAYVLVRFIDAQKSPYLCRFHAVLPSEIG